MKKSMLLDIKDSSGGRHTESWDEEGDEPLDPLLLWWGKIIAGSLFVGALLAWAVEFLEKL